MASRGMSGSASHNLAHKVWQSLPFSFIHSQVQRASSPNILFKITLQTLQFNPIPSFSPSSLTSCWVLQLMQKSSLFMIPRITPLVQSTITGPWYAWQANWGMNRSWTLFLNPDVTLWYLKYRIEYAVDDSVQRPIRISSTISRPVMLEMHWPTFQPKDQRIFSTTGIWNTLLSFPHTSRNSVKKALSCSLIFRKSLCFRPTNNAENATLSAHVVDTEVLPSIDPVSAVAKTTLSFETFAEDFTEEAKEDKVL